eukprot:jgi/Astpho2/3367/Aster-04709
MSSEVGAEHRVAASRDSLSPKQKCMGCNEDIGRAAQLKQRMGLMELPVNRALTTTQREAEMGKARGSFATQEDPGNMQLVAAVAAQQQASSSATYSAQTNSFLRHIAEQKNTGTGGLREAAHMQAAAMELLTGLQHALGSSTGFVLADTHENNHLHSPARKIDCSGLAASSRLWSQLVVPIEFRLHRTEADAALGQLTVTAGLVLRQQPERRFLCGVIITLDTVEAVLVAPVVKPLEAGLPVQQMAQVTPDIADAVEQLTTRNIAHRDISPNSIGILGGRGWLFDFGVAQVVKSWSEPSSPVSGITGTPMYMAIQVLQGKGHTLNTALESLLYSMLSICSDGHLSDRGADFVDDPVGAAMQRLGFMIQPVLGALQHVPHDKRDFVAALHDGHEISRVCCPQDAQRSGSQAMVAVWSQAGVSPSVELRVLVDGYYRQLDSIGDLPSGHLQFTAYMPGGDLDAAIYGEEDDFEDELDIDEMTYEELKALCDAAGYVCPVCKVEVGSTS